MKFSDIHVRDPFILVDGDKYYLYGSRGPETWGKCTGLDVYVSDDLETWSDAHEVFTKPEDFWSDFNFWAPEVHKYEGSYYMFVSFKSDTRRRGTQILKSDSPMGPFLVHSDGPVTPAEWECLDGTLYVNKEGTPYMVFCHEWVQIKDGEMCAVELSKDLKEAVGEPFVLFKASDPVWAVSVEGEGNFVTDGPFLYRTKEDELLMIWSSFCTDGYAEGIAYSDNGDITGNWKQKEEMLFSKDGGHGMIFTSKENEKYFIFHSPNKSPMERPTLRAIEEKDGMLYTK